MIRILTAMIMLLITTCVYADEQTSMVKQTIAAFMQKNKVPGAAVELYVNGKPQMYYFGYANKEKKIPITKNTIFEVASITKVMTSLLLAQQVDAAKAQIDDPITNYVPHLSTKFEDITLENLATHTAGLPFIFSAEKNFSSWSPTYAIDEEWVYSNVGIRMLGDALQDMTHKKIGQLYRDNILLPLKMTSSGINISTQNKKYIAQGYGANGSPAKLLPVDANASAYSMKISAADMQHFLAATIGLPGTEERLFYQMRMTQAAYVKLADNRDQGLGWEIHSLASDNVQRLLEEPESMTFGPVQVVEIYDRPKFNGDALIDKTGTSDGFCAYLAVIPNKQAGIVILVNRVVPHGEIVRTAREILFTMTDMMPDA